MAEYQGRKVTLNKPFRTPGKSKKFAVYVRNQRTKRVQIVRYGDPTMRIKKNIPAHSKVNTMPTIFFRINPNRWIAPKTRERPNTRTRIPSSIYLPHMQIFNAFSVSGFYL